MRGLTLFVLVLLISGCFGGPPEDKEDGETSSGPDGAADLPLDPAEVDAPEWTIGQWWRWEVSGRSFDAFEFTTVVGRSTNDGYHLGSPDLPESLRAHILHVPPQGEVSMPGFGWYIHGDDVALIDFPLTDGKTWTGSLEGDSLAFVAQEETRGGDTVFTVNSTYVEGGGQGPRYVYDPTIGTFSEIHLHYGGPIPFSSARIVESGDGYEGEVRLPTPRDKFLEGASSPITTVPPHGSFTSPQEKEWLVLACWLGGETGSYGITFVTPSATEDPLRCSFQNEAAGFTGHVEVLWRSSVPGEWNVIFDIAGNGYATAEVIGVHEQRCSLGGDLPELPACA